MLSTLLVIWISFFLLALIIYFINHTSALTLMNLIKLKKMERSSRSYFLKTKRGFNFFSGDNLTEIGDGTGIVNYDRKRLYRKREAITFIKGCEKPTNIQNYISVTKKVNEDFLSTLKYNIKLHLYNLEKKEFNDEAFNYVSRYTNHDVRSTDFIDFYTFDFIFYKGFSNSKYNNFKKKLLRLGYILVKPEIDIEKQLKNNIYSVQEQGKEIYFNKDHKQIELLKKDDLKIMFQSEVDNQFSIRIYDSRLFYAGKYTLTLFEQPSENIHKIISNAIKIKFDEHFSDDDIDRKRKLLSNKNAVLKFDIYKNEYEYLTSKNSLYKEFESNSSGIGFKEKDVIMNYLRLSEYENLRLLFLTDPDLADKIGSYIEPVDLKKYSNLVL